MELAIYEDAGVEVCRAEVAKNGIEQFRHSYDVSVTKHDETQSARV
jgi:hypothetical protein